MPRTSSDPLAGMLTGLGQREKKEKEKGKKAKDKKSKGKLFGSLMFLAFPMTRTMPGVIPFYFAMFHSLFKECDDPTFQLLALLGRAASTKR